jgi:hypothetical protein
MKPTILLALLLPCIPATLHAGDKNKDKDDDDVRVGRYYTIDANGERHGHSYIITGREGLGVVTGDDGKKSTYLVTPDITVETSRDR